MGATAVALQTVFASQVVWRSLLFRKPGAAPWPLALSRCCLALESYGSPLLAATVGATLLAVCLRADPLHAAAARVLSAQAWYLPAKLSYPLYLAHEQARLWVALYLLPLFPAGALRALTTAHPLAGFLAISAGTLAAGYVVAFAAKTAVDRLLPRRWRR